MEYWVSAALFYFSVLFIKQNINFLTTTVVRVSCFLCSGIKIDLHYSEVHLLCFLLLRVYLVVELLMFGALYFFNALINLIHFIKYNSLCVFGFNSLVICHIILYAALVSVRYSFLGLFFCNLNLSISPSLLQPGFNYPTFFSVILESTITHGYFSWINVS